MGKGGLNRVLLTPQDATSNPDIFVLPRDDFRATHIRTFLYESSPKNLRVAVSQRFLHDAAIARVQDDQSVLIEVPSFERQHIPNPPPVALVVAMQRPKVIGRVLESAAALGVSVICIVAADKVEKSYWDCKLLRPNFADSSRTASSVSKHDDDDGECDSDHDANVDQPSESNLKMDITLPKNRTNSEKDAYNGSLTPLVEPSFTPKDNKSCSSSGTSVLPGRPRGARNHPHLNAREQFHEHTRRVDGLPAVRRRLELALQQASTDAHVPAVILERRGLSALLKADHQIWEYVPWNSTCVVTHPYPHNGVPLLSVTSVISTAVSNAAVLAIGPEGGWTPSELDVLVAAGFAIAGLGERVLRSETAVVVSLGLVHEGLRLREVRTEEVRKTEQGDTLKRNGSRNE